jgi:uracil-DNA glycosylase
MVGLKTDHRTDGGTPMWDQWWANRGTPDEYDEGPPPALAKLFAETPHYRAIGVAFGKAKFRWHFGPMFYRGRTAPGSVRVLVIGQEGAQDESLSHRSFTGGTGARIQHLLNHIGINRAYLFLNTFVYPINGQYTGGFPTLAQHPDSPIARHRTKILDHVLANNEVRLVIAVGRAAKESAQTLIELHGGTATTDSLHLASGHDLGPLIRFVGVPHPGGAGKGGSVAAIKAGFQDAIEQVATWAADDSSWLPVDPGATRSTLELYKYTSAPIPFRDFAFGTPWRLGSGATSSNRRDDQASIQVFSDDGKYNNSDAVVAYSIPVGTNVGYFADPGDVDVEPPRVKHLEFDKGPGEFASLLMGRGPGLDWPDFGQFGLKAHSSFGFGASYRGRLKSPEILVLADQSCHDDMFLARAYTGEAGQILQGWLRAGGITKRYAIVRTLPVDMLSAPATAVTAAVDSPEVTKLLTAIVKKANPKVVVAIGSHASRIVNLIVPPGTPTIMLDQWTGPAMKANWTNGLAQLTTFDYQTDVAPSAPGAWTATREQIPRVDLPYGTLRWQGSSGDRAAMAKTGGKPNPNYLKYMLPGWAAALGPVAMTTDEESAVAGLPH